MLLLLLLLSRFKSCPTLCDPIDGSPPGSPIPGILQIRILEWVAATPWTAAYQALPSMGFSRQEYWSGVPLPSPYVWLVATMFDSTENISIITKRLLAGAVVDQQFPQSTMSMTWEGYFDSVNTHKYPIPLVLRGSQSY